MEPGEFEGVVGRRLEESTPWWPPLPAAPGRRAERRHRAARRRRLRPVRLLRLGHRDADVRPARRRRAALQQLPHDGAVLADAGLPADRAQPPPQRDGAASSSSRPGFPGYDATMPTANGFLSEVLVAQRVRDVRRRQVAPRAGAGDGDGRAARALAARARVRALLRLPRRRDRPVPPRPRPRQPPGRPAAHAGGGLPPHRGPRRPGDRLPRATCGRARPTGRSSSTSRRARATPRTRCRRRTSTATAAASTTAGTAGARRCSPASRRAGCCRRARGSASGRTGCRRGTRWATTSAGCTPG